MSSSGTGRRGPAACLRLLPGRAAGGAGSWAPRPARPRLPAPAALPVHQAPRDPGRAPARRIARELDARRRGGVGRAAVRAGGRRGRGCAAAARRAAGAAGRRAVRGGGPGGGRAHGGAAARAARRARARTDRLRAARHRPRGGLAASRQRPLRPALTAAACGGPPSQPLPAPVSLYLFETRAAVGPSTRASFPAVCCEPGEADLAAAPRAGLRQSGGDRRGPAAGGGRLRHTGEPAAAGPVRVRRAGRRVGPRRRLLLSVGMPQLLLPPSLFLYQADENICSVLAARHCVGARACSNA